MPYKELYLCCFLTVSCPINAILGNLMFWFFTYQEEDKGKLACPTAALPEEKVTSKVCLFCNKTINANKKTKQGFCKIL